VGGAQLQLHGFECKHRVVRGRGAGVFAGGEDTCPCAPRESQVIADGTDSLTGGGESHLSYTVSNARTGRCVGGAQGSSPKAKIPAPAPRVSGR